MSASANLCQTSPPGRSSAERVNRLAGEQSPYLLQHARNPVDWYPWSAEALRRAERENKPIFLSIGYSACHWCHVMERESFAEASTAAVLNEHFIAVKVDREEHPELDEIYMTAVQLMTGRGGWPLSVFLTPDLKPFFGGTYFPPADYPGLPGFKKVLRAVADLWRTQPRQVAESAEEICRALRAGLTPATSSVERPDTLLLDHAVAELQAEFDPVCGGFGGAPKFPPYGALKLLLRQHRRTGDPQPLEMAGLTLDRMARGGIHDQLGGGFHRYAVDAGWLTPHFEKMLYDNAQLAQVYLEAWRITGKNLYRGVAAGIFDYVLREMTDPRGGFYASQDADSEGKEGKFYLWRAGEFRDILGEAESDLFCSYYGVSDQGNFEGANILHVPDEPDHFARRRGISEKELHERLAPLRLRLLAERNRRIPPGRDEKIVAAWNGMMIAALARGGQALGEKAYVEAAGRAADYVLNEMFRDGTLLHVSRGDAQSKNAIPGFLDDYAEMTGALLDLYEAGRDRRRLEAADRLCRRMEDDFWDEAQGGFFFTSAAHQNLLLRTKPFYDNPLPSGNAAAARALLRLSKLLDDPRRFRKAEQLLALATGAMRIQPRAHLGLLCATAGYLQDLGR
jgi:uncharacterized protein YyaL (SSP411 family)